MTSSELKVDNLRRVATFPHLRPTSRSRASNHRRSMFHSPCSHLTNSRVYVPGIIIYTDGCQVGEQPIMRVVCWQLDAIPEGWNRHNNLIGFNVMSGSAYSNIWTKYSPVRNSIAKETLGMVAGTWPGLRQ